MNNSMVIRELERLYHQFQAANELVKAYEVLMQINALKPGVTENTVAGGQQILHG